MFKDNLFICYTLAYKIAKTEFDIDCFLLKGYSKIL